jgi:hypothetical protein
MSKKSRDQRKRKRTKQRLEIKVTTSEKVIKDESSKKARIEALNYLALFARHQAKLKAGEPSDCWKFNKTRQVWLLKHCYSLEKLPPKHFKIFVKYVQTVKGEQAREVSNCALTLQRILKDALVLVEARGPNGELDTSKVQLDAIEEQLVKEETAKNAKLGDELRGKILDNKLKRAGKVADALS